jgi:hypothetical protein
MGKVSWLNNHSYRTKELTELDVSKYEYLAWFVFCHSEDHYEHGSLTSLKLPVEGEKLARINVSGNQLSDLSIFTHLVNLKELILDDNNFSGTLRPLRKLTKLRNLSIFETNLNEGLEYLPFSVETFRCNKYKGGKNFWRTRCESEFVKLLGVPWDTRTMRFWKSVRKFSVVYEKEQLDEWRGIHFQLVRNAEKRAEFEELLAQLKLASQHWIPNDESKASFISFY